MYGTYKFGNKYLPSAYKTQFEFTSHFSGGKVRLIGLEIRYNICKIHNKVVLDYKFIHFIKNTTGMPQLKISNSNSQKIY
jgi:hypothetical protein